MTIWAWYVGLALRAALFARLIPWAKRLPCFALLLAVYLIQSAGTRYLLADAVAADRWAAWMEPIYCLARVAAYLEAFRWFCHTIPGFAIGRHVLAVSVVGGVALQWFTPGGGSPWFRLAAGLERGTGVGIAAALLFAIVLYECFRGFDASARWHMATLALWSVLDAVGWILISRGRWYDGGHLIIAASIACPVLWLAMVRTAPNWNTPPPPDPELEEAERKLEDAKAKARAAGIPGF